VDSRKTLILIGAGAACLVAGYVSAHADNMKILVLVFAGLSVVAAFFRPRAVVYAWLAGSALAYPFWMEHISSRLTVHAAFAVFLLTVLMARWLTTGRWPKLYWWELLFPIFGLACMLSSLRGAAYAVTPVGLFRDLVLPFSVYLFAREFMADGRKLRIVAILALLTGVWVASVGYYEYTTDRHFWAPIDAASQISKAIGPYQSEMRYGFMQVMHFFLGLYLIRTLQRREMSSVLKFLIGVPLLVWIGYSTILSSQRSVVIAFVASLAVQIYYLRHRVWSATFIIFVLFLFFYNYTHLLDTTVIQQKLTVTDHSAKVRVAQNIQALNIFVDYPFFGVGYHYFNNPRRVDKYLAYFKGASSRGHFIHNSALYTLATSGLFGALPYILSRLGMMIFIFRAVGRTRGHPDHLMMVTAMSIFVAYFFIDQSNAIAYAEVVSTLFFLVIGIAVGRYETIRRERTEAALPPSRASSRPALAAGPAARRTDSL